MVHKRQAQRMAQIRYPLVVGESAPCNNASQTDRWGGLQALCVMVVDTTNQSRQRLMPNTLTDPNTEPYCAVWGVVSDYNHIWNPSAEIPDLGAVVELLERGPPVWEIGSSVPSRVKPVTYKIDTCHFVAWRSALIG